jgi:hypothetical protein
VSGTIDRIADVSSACRRRVAVRREHLFDPLDHATRARHVAPFAIGRARALVLDDEEAIQEAVEDARRRRIVS